MKLPEYRTLICVPLRNPRLYLTYKETIPLAGIQGKISIFTRANRAAACRPAGGRLGQKSMTVDKKELGHCLKDARKSAGFTQEKLAEKVGMSPAAISKIERGLTLPSLDNFIGIVNALGISADEILDQVNHKTYRLKLSFLTERFYRLQHRDQMKILKVVEFLVDNH